MNVFEKIADLQEHLAGWRKNNKSVGLVPTMGALHSGHLSLIERAKSENEVVVCSVFVNPIQFNNPEDLEKYPRDLKKDLALLEEAGCDVVFTPTPGEMYPEPDTTIFDLGGLDKVMEGKFRPGHFNGVAVVVTKLFSIVQPQRAYFGEKDFQQLAIIRYFTRNLQLPVQIIGCPIVRDSDGLAKSSRNQRLTADERAIAPFIYQTLCHAKEKLLESYRQISVEELTTWVVAQIQQNEQLKVEYFEIVDAQTLLPVKNWYDSQNIIGCITVYCGEIRLIDNIIFF
jgi:pantoate--beta-alanine ligase